MGWLRNSSVSFLLVCWLAQPEVAAQTHTVRDGAQRGYLAVQLGDNGDYEVVDAHNAETLFVPASVLKLATVAAALDHLGSEYEWRTRLIATQPLRDGVIQGDLVVRPGADPTWNRANFRQGSRSPLAQLARRAQAAGLVRVTGDLVVDKTVFPGRAHPIERTYGDLPYRYGTPTAGLAIDGATITVRVAPGDRIGAPAFVEAPTGVEILNQTATVGRGRHGAGTLDFMPVWGTNMLVLRGEYPISEEPFVVAVSDSEPERRAARALRGALEDLGVTVEGSVRLGEPFVESSVAQELVAELRSPALETVLDRILTSSNNWYADMLALTLAREVAGTGRFRDGAAVVSTFLANLSDEGQGSKPRLVIRDGSGLSAMNLLTPMTIVGLLAHVIEQPWGDQLVSALPVTGEGTLAAWPSVPQIAAKTGTLRHTVGLAGYLEMGNEPPIIFCYFVNHLPGPSSIGRGEIASSLERWHLLGMSH